MNAELVGVWEHMRELGLSELAHANRHSAYYDPMNPRWTELSVLQAAHAAEILIKARISEEHPMLIFEEFPKIPNDVNSEITVQNLFEKGKTIQWSDLATRLWASTGIRIPNKDIFDKFGKLRNGVQHFAPLSVLQNSEPNTLEFVFKVIDPFINQCWGLYAIDFDEDDDSYEHFTGNLASNEILFLVSKSAAENFAYWDVDWSKISDDYETEMKKRVELALK